MKPHKAVYLLATLFMVATLYSPLIATPTTYDNLPYGIGVQFSPSIWGLSYYQSYGTQAIQGTVGIIYEPDPLWQDTILAYGVEIDYQHTLYVNDFNEYLGAQLYATASLAHSGEIADDYESRGTDPYSAKIIVGAGFGVETLFFQNFSLPLEIVYQFSYSPTESDISKAFALDLIPKVGLRFRFK